MTLPITILNIIKAIQKRLEITPKNDDVVMISRYDFRDEDGELIPEEDVKMILKKLTEDEKILQVLDARDKIKIQENDMEATSDYLHRDEIKLKINRERFQKFYKEHKEHLPPSTKMEIETSESEETKDIKIKKFPYRVPAGTKWEFFTIQFLDEENYKRKMAFLAKEKARLQEILQDTDNRVNKQLENAERVFTFARDAKKEFEKENPEKQKQILSNVGSNLLLKDKILKFE